jgi:hypothetical protein
MNNKYENAKIYKITSIHSDLIYIGSTIQKRLSSRKSGHICNYKRWINNGFNYTNPVDSSHIPVAEFNRIVDEKIANGYRIVNRRNAIDDIEITNWNNVDEITEVEFEPARITLRERIESGNPNYSNSESVRTNPEIVSTSNQIVKVRPYVRNY